MKFPLQSTVSIGRYVASQQRRGDRYPLVLMLEPTLACNIACIGFFARHRRTEQHWLSHIVVPVIGALLLIPGFFSVAGITGVPGLSFISALTSPFFTMSQISRMCWRKGLPSLATSVGLVVTPSTTPMSTP
jgi:hypothetical protein